VLRENQERKTQQPLIVSLEMSFCELPKHVFDKSGMYRSFGRRIGEKLVELEACKVGSNNYVIKKVRVVIRVASSNSASASEGLLLAPWRLSDAKIPALPQRTGVRPTSLKKY
jgi:hypothetical protein